jgi:hypothetical protein
MEFSSETLIFTSQNSGVPRNNTEMSGEPTDDASEAVRDSFVR